MMKPYYLLLLSLCLSFFSAKTQTNVSGGIYTNTTWTMANSPFTVTGDVVVFPGSVLTIEPGVEIRFDDAKYLEIRGGLISNGTTADSIVFTSSQSNPGLTAWEGIRVMNTQGGSISMSYSVVKYSRDGVGVECCHGGGPLQVSHSSFRYNETALSHYAGSTILYVDQCLVENNYLGADAGDKYITNSLFRNNEMGIDMERGTMEGCEFRGHNQFAISTIGKIRNCLITNNNIGIKEYPTAHFHNNDYYSFEELTNSVIINNGLGIRVKANGIRINQGNYFCDNQTYHVEKIGQENISLSNNCWCDGDSASIAAKIYDGYDDVSRGLVYFLPVATVPNGCDTTIFLSADQPEEAKASTLECYPNPANSRIKIRFRTSFATSVYLELINLNGQVVRILRDDEMEAGHHTIDHDRGDLATGIYFLRLKTEERSEYLKMVFL